jgi:transcriptional regulator with XRE-family HTH domain
MADAGALLLAERHRRSMNQTQMAALLGLTRQKVALLEAGQPGVAADTLLRILADLGVTALAVPSGAPAETRQQAERLLSPLLPPT